MSSAADRELTITKLFAAPRSRVFRAWTDPGQLSQWWGPRGFSAPTCELDVRVGGAILITMQGPPDFIERPLRGVYREIVPDERLVFTLAIDNSGNAWGDFDIPPAVHVVTLADEGAGTRLTVTTQLRTVADRDFMAKHGHREGYMSSLEKMEDLVTQA